jgi:hypothetical protein
MRGPPAARSLADVAWQKGTTRSGEPSWPGNTEVVHAGEAPLLAAAPLGEEK